MAIPDYQTLMLPVLETLRDQNVWRNRDVIETLVNTFSLSDEEKKHLLPSGKQATFDNRVMWAQTYLRKAGLIESVKRGYSKITQQGVDIVCKAPNRIDVNYLMQFPDFQEFRANKRETLQHGEKEIADEIADTPQEFIESGFQKIQSALESELLDRIKACSPEFFERLVLQLLLAMGYGGSREEAGQRIGGSGDGGVDGVINEDKLGLDVIYIQAKRWDNSTVGRPEIQKFVGALQGKRAKKGVFITTSYFSSDARDYVSHINDRVVLIDGEQLAQFMIAHNVGVSTVETYEIKKIDSDYFEE